MILLFPSSNTLASLVTKLYHKSDHCSPSPLGHGDLSLVPLTAHWLLLWSPTALPHTAAKISFLKLEFHQATLLFKVPPMVSTVLRLKSKLFLNPQSPSQSSLCWPLQPHLLWFSPGSLSFSHAVLLSVPQRGQNHFYVRSLYLLCVLPRRLLSHISVYLLLLIQVLVQMLSPWRREQKKHKISSHFPQTYYLLPATVFSLLCGICHYLKSSSSIFCSCLLVAFLQ